MSAVKGRIAILDDEPNVAWVLQTMLERAGYEVWPYSRPAELLESLGAVGSGELDLLITDLSMPGMSGMEVLEGARSMLPELPVVMLTAFGTVESAVTALKRGAFDFLTKPFDKTELLSVAEKAVRTARARNREPAVVAPRGGQMQEIEKLVSKVARSPSTVLIWGESGTGKELVATEIHRQSDRADKPLIKVNCAAVPATLMESEFFGHERGAFTGAVASRPGRFELAHEGTLFLDEVGEMAPEMQVKLLRVIQNQEFERVGGVSSLRVNVRIVAATNKDLEEEVRAGRFREDLFYRLNVFPIKLPPLRDRRDDFDRLVGEFIAAFNRKLGKSVSGLAADAMAALRAYSWPGNIRQLENTLERMMLLSESPELELLDVPQEILTEIGALRPTSSSGKVTFKDRVKQSTRFVERDLIEGALSDTGGNVTRAAQRLGLSRKGLQLKMKELGVRRQLDTP